MAILNRSRPSLEDLDFGPLDAALEAAVTELGRLAEQAGPERGDALGAAVRDRVMLLLTRLQAAGA